MFKTGTTFYQRFLLSRAWLFCMIYLVFFALMLSIVARKYSFEDACHISNLIVLFALALALGLEHLHHWATRKA